MEVLDGNQLLVRGMEEDGYSDGGEAGIHPQNTRDHLLTRRERRRRVCVSAALTLLAVLALALLLTVALGGRAQQSPGSQPMINLSPGAYAGQQRLEGDKNPSAMLTVPNGNITDQDYLKWERDQGNAFCQGGFNYSNGELVVPRKGTYKVFLQITYKSEKGADCKSELQLHNMIYLYRKSYPEYRPLLASHDTEYERALKWQCAH
ncbi:hypothetical protein L3Q82_006707 [Scortum barcoo]|uniref:Uncharacterized protein n=1 Tax=Scortum barcoo TaxID=214431 RepID=A0ACB8WX33_9TELE|nr:hypothetical protein L3Q82_006707 [Scortum barcoo]